MDFSIPKGKTKTELSEGPKESPTSSDPLELGALPSGHTRAGIPLSVHTEVGILLSEHTGRAPGPCSFAGCNQHWHSHGVE